MTTLTSWVLFAALVAPPAAGAGTPALSPPFRAVLRGRRGKHAFTLLLQKRRFSRARHRVRCSGHEVSIDGAYMITPYNAKHGRRKQSDGGQNWYGTNGELPWEELSRFEVTVDGRHWSVPGSLWRGCYQPHLNTTGKEPALQARLSRDGRRLDVEMLGSDGSAYYRVLWHLRRSGKHGREASAAS